MNKGIVFGSVNVRLFLLTIVWVSFCNIIDLKTSGLKRATIYLAHSSASQQFEMCLAEDFFFHSLWCVCGQLPVILAVLPLGVNWMSVGAMVGDWARCFSLSIWLAWACSHGIRVSSTSTGKAFQVYYLSFSNCPLVNASDNAITEATWKSSTEDEYKEVWTNWRQNWGQFTTVFSNREEVADLNVKRTKFLVNQTSLPNQLFQSNSFRSLRLTLYSTSSQSIQPHILFSS